MSSSKPCAGKKGRGERKTGPSLTATSAFLVPQLTPTKDLPQAEQADEPPVQAVEVEEEEEEEEEGILEVLEDSILSRCCCCLRFVNLCQFCVLVSKFRMGGL